MNLRLSNLASLPSRNADAPAESVPSNTASITRSNPQKAIVSDSPDSLTEAASRYKIEISKWGDEKKAAFAAHLLDEVFTFLGPHSSVLEIGPGMGHFADACRARLIDYKAIEPSRSMAESLRSRRYNVINKAVPPIPIEHASIDFVIANHVLEHQPTYSSAMEFLEEIKRVLTPRGRCCVSFPNWHKTKNIFHEMDYSHNFITTPFRVRQMLDNAGLVIEDTYHTNGQVRLRRGLTGWMRRSPLMAIQLLANRNLASVIAEYVGAEDQLGRIRKTVCESVFMLIRKGD